MKLDKFFINTSGILSVITILTFLFFQYSTKKIESDLTALTIPQVAGIQIEKIDPTDITKETPLPLGGEITGIDKLTDNNKEKIIVTIETKNLLSNLENFYRDKLTSDNWEEIEKNYYAKNDKQIKVEIKDKLITLTIIKNITL